MRLNYLSRQSFEGLVYLLFLQERTQKEAIECLYDKEYSKINVKPFKKARENLRDDELLSSSGSLRKRDFQAKLDPFIDWVRDRVENDAELNRRGITADEISGLERFVNSDWFRGLFSLEIIDSLPFLNRNKINRIDYSPRPGSCAINVIGKVLDDVAAFDSGHGNRMLGGGLTIGLGRFSDYETWQDFIEDCSGWFPEEYTLKEGKEALKIEKVSKILEENMLPHVANEAWTKFIIDRLLAEPVLLFRLPEISAFSPLVREDTYPWSGGWDQLIELLAENYRLPSV